MPWREIEPVIDPEVRKLCVRRYPGHPRGCPNHGKKKGCPPSAPLLGDVLDLSRPVYAIWNVFNLASHVARMRERHPEWSPRQLVCCLYWQGTARKNLKAEIDRARKMLPHHHITACPEAMGVNVTDLMKYNAGIELKWPPKITTYQVALAGLRV